MFVVTYKLLKDLFCSRCGISNKTIKGHYLSIVFGYLS